MSTKTKKPTDKQKAEKRMELVSAPGNTDQLAMSAMFSKGKALNKGMTIKSRSPLLKPDLFPVGEIMTGIVKKLITCVAGKNDDGTDKAGCLIEIVPSLDTVGYAIPAVATLMSALEITHVRGSGKEAVFSTPYLNHTVQIEKMAERIPSKKGQAAWMFLVAVSDEPVTV